MIIVTVLLLVRRIKPPVWFGHICAEMCYLLTIHNSMKQMVCNEQQDNS